MNGIAVTDCRFYFTYSLGSVLLWSGFVFLLVLLSPLLDLFTAKRENSDAHSHWERWRKKKTLNRITSLSFYCIDFPRFQKTKPNRSNNPPRCTFHLYFLPSPSFSLFACVRLLCTVPKQRFPLFTRFFLTHLFTSANPVFLHFTSSHILARLALVAGISVYSTQSIDRKKRKARTNARFSISSTRRHTMNRGFVASFLCFCGKSMWNTFEITEKILYELFAAVWENEFRRYFCEIKRKTENRDGTEKNSFFEMFSRRRRTHELEFSQRKFSHLAEKCSYGWHRFVGIRAERVCLCDWNRIWSVYNVYGKQTRAHTHTRALRRREKENRHAVINEKLFIPTLACICAMTFGTITSRTCTGISATVTSTTRSLGGSFCWCLHVARSFKFGSKWSSFKNTHQMMTVSSDLLRIRIYLIHWVESSKSSTFPIGIRVAKTPTNFGFDGKRIRSIEPFSRDSSARTMINFLRYQNIANAA